MEQEKEKKVEKRLYYFGCIGRPGHYFYEYQGMSGDARTIRIPGANTTVLEHCDMVFPPPKYENGYLESSVPPFRIVSWWDQSGDPRPGSNSTLFGIGYSSADEMLDDAAKKFSKVMSRQPRPQPYKPLTP